MTQLSEIYKTTFIPPTLSIRDAVAALDRNALQICLVTDADQKLLGTLTDGDIRRAVLKNVSLSKPVTDIMNPKPTVGSVSETSAIHRRKMRAKRLKHLPILNDAGRLIGLEIIDVLHEHEVRPTKPNEVVIMAGGLGSRLGELTSQSPKPLIDIGGQPVLETILEQLKEFGLRKIWLSVNYKAHLIKEYFKDGSHLGLEIRYLDETVPLGTAGSLSLLPSRLERPLVVMNADVLTTLNFDQLLEFHNKHKGQATLCVREYDIQVPYGVVKIDKSRIASLTEKPRERFFVNAGIYVLAPILLSRIPGSRYDMTELFHTLLDEKEAIHAFPIREYWTDIGHTGDLTRAREEFESVFRT